MYNVPWKSIMGRKEWLLKGLSFLEACVYFENVKHSSCEILRSRYRMSVMALLLLTVVMSAYWTTEIL